MTDSSEKPRTFEETSREGLVDENSKTLPNPRQGFRRDLASKMDVFSRAVNDNLVAARLAAFAGVSALTFYGISQTPLFFRYRTVMELPQSYFVRRRRLYGRVMYVTSSEVSKDCILLGVRHLSPVGRILPTQVYEPAMRLRKKFYPVISTISPDEISCDILRVQVAGIEPANILTSETKPDAILQDLVEKQYTVSCELIARCGDSVDGVRLQRKVKPGSPGFEEVSVSANVGEHGGEQDGSSDVVDPEVAICRVSYRTSIWNVFSTDIAEELIRNGRANTSSSVVVPNAANGAKTKVLDTSRNLRDLRDDARYLEQLTRLEFQAAKDSAGMWSVREIREAREDFLDEVHFQTRSNFLQKSWRWLRGG